jgi:uncharacterized protein (DUF488 family)
MFHPLFTIGHSTRSVDDFVELLRKRRCNSLLFAELRQLGHKRRCAIMRAEDLWWRCHRCIMTDYLITSGETVFHILRKDGIEPVQRTSAANHGRQARTTGSADLSSRSIVNATKADAEAKEKHFGGGTTE